MEAGLIYSVIYGVQLGFSNVRCPCWGFPNSKDSSSFWHTQGPPRLRKVPDGQIPRDTACPPWGFIGATKRVPSQVR